MIEGVCKVWVVRACTGMGECLRAAFGGFRGMAGEGVGSFGWRGGGLKILSGGERGYVSRSPLPPPWGRGHSLRVHWAKKSPAIGTGQRGDTGRDSIEPTGRRQGLGDHALVRPPEPPHAAYSERGRPYAGRPPHRSLEGTPGPFPPLRGVAGPPVAIADIRSCRPPYSSSPRSARSSRCAAKE
jgi:hypothetical protein